MDPVLNSPRYLSYKGAYGQAVLPGNSLFKLTLLSKNPVSVTCLSNDHTLFGSRYSTNGSFDNAAAHAKALANFSLAKRLRSTYILVKLSIKIQLNACYKVVCFHSRYPPGYGLGAKNINGHWHGSSTARKTKNCVSGKRCRV